MNLFDKFLRSIFSLIIIFSIFAVSAQSQPELIVTQDNNEVNELTDYYLNFETTIGNYFRVFHGEFIITLPKGFGLDNLDSVEVIDDFNNFFYTVTKIETDENSVHLHLKLKWTGSLSADDLESQYPAESLDPISISVKLSKIKNPETAGDYQISLLGLKYNQKIAFGPLLSEPFTIKEASIHSIVVTPSEDLIVQAGTYLDFSATAFDKYGNAIEGVEFEWSLDFCSRYSSICIGELTGSSLYATRTGFDKVLATAGEVTGYSGRIEVLPGEFSSISLNIFPYQYVGNVIIRSSVGLRDDYQNLVTDHDLEASPVEIISDQGELINNILNDNNYQFNGVIKLHDFNTTYIGRSGQVGLRAENDDIIKDSSFTILYRAYFNNYDILDLQGVVNNPVVSLIVGETSTAKILIQNRGNERADTVNISYYWQSRPDSITKLTLIPSNIEVVDRVTISLSPLLQVGEFDNLVISTESNFGHGVNIDGHTGEPITTVDERIFPIEVLANTDYQLVAHSFKPDSIINKIPLEISFDVATSGIDSDIDSTQLIIFVLDNINRQIIGELYVGNPVYSSYDGSVIHYENIPAMLSTEQEFQSGFYPISFSYQIYTEGISYSLTEPFVDSIYVTFENSVAEISLVEGSLTPQIVYAGTNVAFEFKINNESSDTYAFHNAYSQFKIYDESFSSSTNLFLETDSIYPGENVLRSANISIQLEQVGKDLFAEAIVSLSLSGMSDTTSFVTNFTEASLPIQVLDVQTVQIIDLEILAPNSPIVNSSQEIQFQASVVNLSSNIIDTLLLELKTIDGASTISNPVLPATDIQPFDTAIVLFDVTASSVSQNLPESFRVDIFDNSISMLPPINNSAFLIIEDEALLDVSYRVNGLENVTGHVVSQGDHIHVQIELNNLGTAQVSGGMYQFIVSGLSSNAPDTFTGFFTSDSTIDYGFEAPMFDTRINFSFSVLQTPIDINYNVPAKMLNDSFDFSVVSVSSMAEIIVEAQLLNNNLVLPGRLKEIVDFSITNTSKSELNPIQINSFDFSFYTSTHQDVDVHDLINVGNSYFIEDGIKSRTATSGGNEFMLWLTDFIIEPQQTRKIRFVAEFKKSVHKEILIELLNTKVEAVYSDGPFVGNNVNVGSISGRSEILTYLLVFKGSSLEESFIIENNPCNPSIEPVQFAYELSEDAPIEFHMFTLTGEEVYREFYQAGSFGATSGENIISWDGRNNSGEIVLNGVYIASILNKQTGDYARIKVAVVK